MEALAEIGVETRRRVLSAVAVLLDDGPELSRRIARSAPGPGVVHYLDTDGNAFSFRLPNAARPRCGSCRDTGKWSTGIACPACSTGLPLDRYPPEKMLADVAQIAFTQAGDPTAALESIRELLQGKRFDRDGRSGELRRASYLVRPAKPGICESCHRGPQPRFEVPWVGITGANEGQDVCAGCKPLFLVGVDYVELETVEASP